VSDGKSRQQNSGLSRSAARARVLVALDSLRGWGNGHWTGNVREVWNRIMDQGGPDISGYIIRSVLREVGEKVRHGQYRVGDFRRQA